MNEVGMQLERVQRWMQAVIMHPGGVAAGVTSEAACEEIEVAHGELEQVIRRSRALTSDARLGIYVDAYFTRLLECLRAEYPVTAHALGAELFDALAFGYLQHYPSRSYTLNLLGANFPKYLAETRLHAAEAPAEPECWAEFIIELAEFEREVRDVFDGPGSEQSSLLSLDALSAIPPERWPDARLRPAECLRVVRFGHSVNAYYTAIREDRQPEPVSPRETFVAIHRRDYVVHRAELTAAQCAALESLVAGGTVGEAIESAAALAPELDALVADIGRWFHEWTAAGFFVGVRLAGEST